MLMLRQVSRWVTASVLVDRHQMEQLRHSRVDLKNMMPLAVAGSQDQAPVVRN